MGNHERACGIGMPATQVEVNMEAPAEIAGQVANKLHECMVEAGKPFCTKCHLDADVSYLEDGTLPDYWIH